MTRSPDDANTESPRPMPAEWLALATVFVALIALALTRVDLTDTPYHLATARLAWETGEWPTTNTFSWTYPDYPLYQQYPVYQSLLYGVYLLSGWEGLSILHLVGWGAVFCLWMAYSGGRRWASVLCLPMMILLLGLRERMVLRPDIMTMIYFVCLLLVVDGYRSRRWLIWFFPVIQLLWVNSHQMFWLGLVIQAAFLGHLIIVRWARGRGPIDTKDGNLPLWPVTAALVLSVGACFLSPIGMQVLEVPAQTMGSLYFHREHVDEFQPFTSSFQATWLVGVGMVLAIAGLVASRRSLVPFEFAVWLLSLAMVLGAIRGTAFFVAMSVAVFARGMRAMWKAKGPDTPSTQSEEGNRFALPRWSAVLVTFLLCAQVFYHRWVDPSRILGGSQVGLGRTLGAWPDHTMAFLRENPPPGKMINLSWYLGNALVWELFPDQKVFVDPRFEAYPRSFLVDALAAEDDVDRLDALLESHQPDWFVGELRVPGVRRQMARLRATGEWSLVYADTVAAVLVKRCPQSEAFLSQHAIDLATWEFPGIVTDEKDIKALQEIRVAWFCAEMGEHGRALDFLNRAQESVRFPGVARELEELRAAIESEVRH